MPTPPLVTQTKLDNEGTTDAKVAAKRTVTYDLTMSSADGVSLPYAVAVGGVVRPGFKNKPGRVRVDTEVIVVRDVDPGKQVTLFLNSDAHPNYRKNPVYPVTPADRNVLVEIQEIEGKHPDTDAPRRVMDKNPAVEAAKTEDTYTAVLTGDIWMRVSHKYSPADVDSLLPPGTSAHVATAVKRIYDGLTTPSLDLVVPPASEGANQRSIKIVFDAGVNAHQNINTGYNHMREGVTRVHPAGYAAIFKAAIDAGVNKVAMSSCWRPMFGSIAHRAGLGLDVESLDATQLNRVDLRNPSANATMNVSPEEKELFAKFKAAKTQEVAAKKAVADASAEVAKSKKSPEKLAVANQKLAEATAASQDATKARKEAELAWNSERDKNEPDHVRRFRASLIQNERVTQVFDPWLMDEHTHGKAAPSPNMQRPGNERVHKNHLHITVEEPKIL